MATVRTVGSVPSCPQVMPRPMSQESIKTNLGTVMQMSKINAHCMSNAARTWHSRSTIHTMVMSVGRISNKVRQTPTCSRVKFHQINKSGMTSINSNKKKNRNMGEGMCKWVGVQMCGCKCAKCNQLVHLYILTFAHFPI